MENNFIMENNSIKEEELKKQVYDYLNSLDEKDKIAYTIAMAHLGTSFNIVRSNGFSEWQKKK